MSVILIIKIMLKGSLMGLVIFSWLNISQYFVRRVLINDVILWVFIMHSLKFHYVLLNWH